MLTSICVFAYVELESCEFQVIEGARVNTVTISWTANAEGMTLVDGVAVRWPDGSVSATRFGVPQILQPGQRLSIAPGELSGKPEVQRARPSMS